MHNLFTYGSLMCADIMERVAGCRCRSTEAILHGFFRSGITGEEYPGIVARSDASVTGVLYLDLPDEAVRRLDIFEGDQYERQVVDVVSEVGICKAMTYVMKDCHRDRLDNREWSYTRFLESGKTRFEKAYLGFDRI